MNIHRMSTYIVVILAALAIGAVGGVLIGRAMYPSTAVSK